MKLFSLRLSLVLIFASAICLLVAWKQQQSAFYVAHNLVPLVALSSAVENTTTLAVMVLAHHDPAQIIREFVQFYSGSRYDIFVLHEGRRINMSAAAAAAPNVTFVDVSMYFNESLLVRRSNGEPTCGAGIGYRLMCRFMSGPVYWLREFDKYDQLLRFDTDSHFTSPITESLMLHGHESYAYALKQKDALQYVSFMHADRQTDTLLCNNFFFFFFCNRPPPPPPHDFCSCQIGFTDLVHSIYEKTGDFLRFGENAWAAPWVRLSWVFNCNFEVVSLRHFRSIHYRTFWDHINSAGLFWSTRLGDHQVKTIYVETFLREDSVVCYADLPYSHPNDHADGGPCGKFHVGRTRSFSPLRNDSK